jgi:regulator of protease activity HflC (stomatin/prohibitin superfamily)
VQASLSDSLKDNYVEIVDVLIRNVQFDPDYENKIRKRKLADQEVEVNKSMKRSLEMQGKRQVVEAETKKMLSVIKQEKEATLVTMEAQVNREITKIVAEYEQYATEKQADSDLIAAEMEAKGNLLVKEAEAEGERLRNMAMQGVGGSTIVALEAAKNLDIKEITISTVETDLLDIDKMATKLGVPKNK